MSLDLTLYILEGRRKMMQESCSPLAIIEFSTIYSEMACFDSDIRGGNVLPSCLSKPLVPQLVPVTCALSLVEGGETFIDCRDATLTFVTTGGISQLKMPEGDGTSDLFRAVQAFCSKLPKEAPVILYWR